MIPVATLHISDHNLKMVSSQSTHSERCPDTPLVATKLYTFQGGVTFNSTHPVHKNAKILNSEIKLMPPPQGWRGNKHESVRYFTVYMPKYSPFHLLPVRSCTNVNFAVRI